MELTSFKIAGILGGTSAAVAGAYGVYHFSSSSVNETIKSKLEAHFKGTNTIFLTVDHEEWTKLETRYNSLQNKPKETDGKTDLPFSKVKTWCTDSVGKSFRSESDDLYKQVKEICFLNVNTLLGELGKTSLKSTQPANHADWQNAWDAYNSQKSVKGLEIKDSDNETNLNGPSTDKSKGGPVLHAWCTKTKDKKMYDAESLLPAFKAWCVN